MTGWLQARVDEFTALRGMVVRSWSGVEMAVRGGDGDRPEFDGPDVPCLQCWQLSADLSSGRRVVVGTYQDDGYWGLRPDVAPAGNDRPGVPAPGYRSRALPEVPTGRITDVDVVIEGQILAEVAVHIGAQGVLLIAGEADGRLWWRRLDESVLVFTNPIAAERMIWAPARTQPTAAPPAEGAGL